MHSSNQSLSAANQGGAVDFFVRPIFRSTFFMIITFMLGLDVTLCFLILMKNWHHMSSLAVSFVAFVILFLIATWHLGYKAHEKIRMLFTIKQIDQVERGSALDTVLAATSNMLLGALFAAFLLAGFCLGALGEALSSH